MTTGRRAGPHGIGSVYYTIGGAILFTAAT